MNGARIVILAGLIGLGSLSIVLAADKPDAVLGAEYGAYDTARGRSIAAIGTDAGVISLAGDWRCALDPDKKGFAAFLLDRSIRLPGTLDEAGYGDRSEETSLRCLSRRFQYVGPAWYQREIVVSPDWADKRITLTFERVMWESRVWIDETPIGARDSLCTPHEYELTGHLAPGTHRLTVRVDNSGRPGANCHGYGDDEQIRWNGLLGKLELRVQDAVHIRGVQAYPDLAKKRLVFHVELGNITGESCDGTVKVAVCDTVTTANFKIAGETLPVEVAVPLDAKFTLWDEFTPNLHEADVTVAAEAGGRKTFDRTTVTFGLRELGKRGTQLTMNGRALFLRGTHDGGGFPLTGHPAMDVAAWRKIFRTCKEHGLNHVRYHSFCPPDAAFCAADEEGIILQPELPVWGRIGADWAGTPFLRAEFAVIMKGPAPEPGYEQGRIRMMERLLNGEPPAFDADYRDIVKQFDVPTFAHELGQCWVFPDLREVAKYTGVLRVQSAMAVGARCGSTVAACAGRRCQRASRRRPRFAVGSDERTRRRCQVDRRYARLAESGVAVDQAARRATPHDGWPDVACGPAEEVGLPDVMQYHEYAGKDVFFKEGPKRVLVTFGHQRNVGGVRPLLIGEFGMCTARDAQHGATPEQSTKMRVSTGTEAEQARLYEIVLAGAEQGQAAGALAWCLHDYPIKNPDESHFGLVRSDGSLKPAAIVLRETFSRWSRP